MSHSRTTLISIIILVLCLLLIGGNAAFAIPYLQLDADPAIYVGGDEESVVTLGDEFTLYALVDTATAGGQYYLSIALTPPLDTAAILGSFELTGSFIFDNGTDPIEIITDGTKTINVTGDMTYGIPPLNLLSNPGLLGPHGIYDTYFIEVPFTLTPSGISKEYNVQDNPGGPQAYLSSDDTLMYQEFAVDASLLNDDYFLHFDLYTKDLDGKISDFAPFSHDLQHIPIPPSVIIGLLGMGIAGIKLRKFA